MRCRTTPTHTREDATRPRRIRLGRLRRCSRPTRSTRGGSSLNLQRRYPRDLRCRSPRRCYPRTTGRLRQSPRTLGLVRYSYPKPPKSTLRTKSHLASPRWLRTTSSYPNRPKPSRRDRTCHSIKPSRGCSPPCWLGGRPLDQSQQQRKPMRSGRGNRTASRICQRRTQPRNPLPHSLPTNPNLANLPGQSWLRT